jgi:hypothetical protein
MSAVGIDSSNVASTNIFGPASDNSSGKNDSFNGRRFRR